MIEAIKSDLSIVKRWLDEGRHDLAGPTLTSYMMANPDCEQGLFLLGRLMLDQESPVLARFIYEKTTQGEGAKRWQDWLNLGSAFDHLNQPEDAERCYKVALELSPDNQSALACLGTCYVQQYRSEEAEAVLKKCIELHPDARKAVSSLGFALLQQRKWGEGWDAYEAGYGKLKDRTERQYRGEGLWNGAKKKTERILVHGEQGIGDQIAGLEPLNDLAEQTTVVGVEVSAKLESLVQRSYPDLDVHGTLEETDLEWPLTKDITSHCGPFTIHKYYRRKESDYPKKPYLVADPVRKLQWRAYFDSLGPEPKIGIAWTGGSHLTHSAKRRSPLSEWMPIFNQDAHFISLEYKNRDDDIQAIARRRKVKIHNFPWATRSKDYDDAAALIDELDLIICVPQSAVHLAGALGKTVWCMVHDTPNIHYTSQGDHLAYYRDVQLFRRGDDWSVISTIAEKLADWIKDSADAPRLRRA